VVKNFTSLQPGKKPMVFTTAEIERPQRMAEEFQREEQQRNTNE
jgi:hypothetical protein